MFRYLLAIVTLLLLYSCDSAYTLYVMIENKSSDTLLVSYKTYKFDNAEITVSIPPNATDTLYSEFIVRKASTFDGCCPCSFKEINSQDSSLALSSSSRWTTEFQDKDRHHEDGFVNCIFRKK